jgi:hypothetical protein
MKASNQGIVRFGIRADGATQIYSGGLSVTGGVSVTADGLKVTGGTTVYSGSSSETLKVSENISNTGLFLPSHLLLTEEQICYVCTVIRSFFI